MCSATKMNSIFEEPREKGIGEWFQLEENKLGWKEFLFLVLAIIALAFCLKTAIHFTSAGEWWTGSDVVEREGVLYYPDGVPVRNYEQLNLYLNSN